MDNPNKITEPTTLEDREMPLTPEQLKERENYLGGSDIAALLGWSPWCTPYKLWEQKTGRAGAKKQTREQARGDDLEKRILEEYSKSSGHALQTVNDTILHPEYKFLAANIDARGVDAPIIVDAKSMNVFAAHKNLDFRSDDGIPRYWICQGFHYLEICQFAEQCVFAVKLVNDSNPEEDIPLQTFVIDRNDHIQKRQTKKAVKWWFEYVVADAAPPLANVADVRSMYRQGSPGTAIEANPSIAVAMDQYLKTEREIKERNAELEHLQLLIMEFMGEREVLTHNGKELATWKKSGKSRAFRPNRRGQPQA